MHREGIALIGENLYTYIRELIERYMCCSFCPYEYDIRNSLHFFGIQSILRTLAGFWPSQDPPVRWWVESACVMDFQLADKEIEGISLEIDCIGLVKTRAQYSSGLRIN